ncbi:MAG TPA: class I SAM-dependent methyltransferase [Microlunatus sp.]
MVTLASQPDPAAADAPHRHRELAESFGSDAERYDRARPHYPAELAELVLADLDGRSVLDVGIGTGISAERFAAAGCRVAGVEVDERMAELARRRGYPVEVATFEQWDPNGRSYDLLISGQTWHWIDPDAGAAKAAEVVRPDGRVALFWNVGDPVPEIAAAFAAVYRSLDTGLPFTPWARSAVRGYGPIVDKTTAGLDRSAAFGEVRQAELPWQTVITKEDWLDQVPTAGGHSRIPAAILDELLTGMAAVIDRAGGSFQMNYTTLLLSAVRR